MTFARLLQEQLVAIARIVKRELNEQDLQHSTAQVENFIDLFSDNVKTGKAVTFEYILLNSGETLHELEHLGFMGYRTYMICVGLRLAAIQELEKIGKTSERDAIHNTIERATGFHKEILALIDTETDPSTSMALREQKPFASQEVLSVGGAINQYHDLNVLGDSVSGWVPVGLNLMPLPLQQTSQLVNKVLHPIAPVGLFFPLENGPIDWTALRTQLYAENTDLGQKILNTWNAAKTK